MKRVLLFISLLTFGTHGYCQTGDVWENIKKEFSDEPAVFLERGEILTLEVDGDSLHAYSDVIEDIIFLKEQPDMLSSKRIYGSHFNKVEDIKAKTLVWEKNKYKEISVSDFKKNSDRSSNIFFDDSYYYSFNFPAVASRNRTHLEYRNSVKDPKFIDGYMVASYLPQAKVSYTIKATKGVEIAYEVLHDPHNLIKFKKTEKGNVVMYEWTAANLPAIKMDEQSPDVRYYAPHIVCYVKSYQTKKGKVNVLSNLDDLYHWYRTFVQNLNKEQSNELVAIVDELKRSSTSETDLVRKIFYWVQDNIQYIAFEQGMRGLIPHSGSYVCEKRYGDCKDMANLIVNMLGIANIKAYHTWIGSRDIPYRYSSLPTPLVDNHMIATYVDPTGKYYFLDATGKYTPFGYPTSMIQGKEAFIGFDETRYEVTEVPVVDKTRNTMIDSAVVSFDETTLKGSGKVTFNGFAKVFGAYQFDRTDQDETKKSLTRLVGKGSNKFFLDQYNITNLENRDKPTFINYSFRIANYFQKLGNEIYVNLNLKKDYYNDFINTNTRKTPKEVEYQYDELEVTELLLPEGYTVEYIPSNVKHEGKLLGFEITYKSLPGRIIYSKKSYSNFLLMTPEQFELWNESIKLLSESYKESIILKKK